jgi:DNA-binding MarR family transcriptional regulator
MSESGNTDPEPRWLDKEEMDAWLQLAGVIIKLPAALDAQLQRDAGISHFEFAVLARLSEAEGHTLRMSTLATFAHGSLSRLSHVVKRLESKGWVYREPCRDDGRYTNAVLTDLGYAKLASAAPGHVEAVRTLVVDALSDEQLGHVGEIGRIVLKRIDAETLPR